MMSVKDFKEKQVLFLVTKDGQKLSFRNDNILIKDKNGNVIHQSTCYRLFAIYVVGHISITSGLIQRAKKFGFAIVLLTASFRMYQVISSSAEGNVVLRKHQYEYTSLTAAKNIIRNKMINQRSVLMNIRDKDEKIKNSISKIDGYISEIEYSDSIRSIMGIEGSASKVYFNTFFDNVAWRGRKPRIKFDMTNALLDMGYTTLFAFVDSVLAIYGFDRYVGVLHRQFYMRKSLVCDLVEPFRVIIDTQVKKSINLNQFQEKDFEIYDGKWVLKYKNISQYSNVFLKAILEYKEDIFIYIRDFYRNFMKDNFEKSFPEWRF